MPNNSRSLPKLLRFADLKEAGIVRNWPQLKRLVEGSGFPPGFLLSHSARVWDEADVAKWIADRRETTSRSSDDE